MAVVLSPPHLPSDYTNVQFYLQDAVRQLLVKREGDNPVTFFRDYFKRCGLLRHCSHADLEEHGVVLSDGSCHGHRLQSQSHVQQREFGFVTRTQYNKRAFVLLCEDTFTSIIATEGACRGPGRDP